MATTLVLVVGVTLFMSALCSLLEATLFSTRVASLEAAKSDGHHLVAAGHMLDLKRDVSKPTSAILILNTIANTAGATVAGMLAAQVWGGSAVPLFSAVLTAAILFLSEILPKTFGVMHWRGIWPFVALPLKGLVTALRPLIWVTEHFSSLIVARGRKTPVTTEAEIVAMIQMGAGAGQLTRTETELLTSVFHFDELFCSDVMIPWTNVVRLDASWSRERCVEVIREAGHSRYPVTDGAGEVLGVLRVADLMMAGPDVSPVDVLRSVMKVPESLSVPALLRDMQAERLPVAIVVDEYGNTTGFLTVVDLIEEIVGVLGDEKDSGRAGARAGGRRRLSGFRGPADIAGPTGHRYRAAGAAERSYDVRMACSVSRASSPGWRRGGGDRRDHQGGECCQPPCGPHPCGPRRSGDSPDEQSDGPV